jgi:hypothetical protein
MFLQFWKIIWWLFRVGVMVWFLLMPVLPIYGWLLPWPEAEQKLEAEGVSGTKLMIGASRDSEREDGRWSEERQRSYIVLPASLRSMQIFTYREAKGSQIAGVDRELLSSQWLIQLFLLWIAAGWFSVRTATLWIREFKGANKALQATAATPGS